MAKLYLLPPIENGPIYSNIGEIQDGGRVSEATLTSSRTKLELQLNYRTIILNNQLKTR